MILTTECKLLLALAIGFFLNKRGILNGKTNRAISTMIMDIILPIVCITSISNISGIDKLAVLKFMITGCVLIIIYPFLARFFTFVLRVPKERRGVYNCTFVFANVMFMGYPVSSSLYGDESLFYICIFYILFNLFYFTYGVRNLLKGTGHDPDAGRDQVSNRAARRQKLRSFFSNGTVASLFALVLFLFDIQLPDASIEVMSFVGDIAVPLSMIIIGSSIGMYPLKDLVADKRIFGAAAIRLIVYPLLIYLFITVLGFTGEMRGIATITAGMPAASMIAMSCTQHGVHEKEGNSIVAFTTICSIITIPFLLALMSRFA